MNKKAEIAGSGFFSIDEKLPEAGVEHRFEEFEGTHSGMDFRMDVSLPFLYETLNTVQEASQ